MKWLPLLMLPLMVSGCATTGKYEKVLQSWVGSSELDLVRSWGPPQQTYEASDRKFLIYSSSNDMYLPGSGPTYQTTVVGNTAYTNSYGGTPAMNIQLSCTTTFEITADVITSWQWRGNNCVSR